MDEEIIIKEFIQEILFVFVEKSQKISEETLIRALLATAIKLIFELYEPIKALEQINECAFLLLKGKKERENEK